MKTIKKQSVPTGKTPPKKKQPPWVYGLGLGALFGGGYLLYHFFQNKAAGGGNTIILNPATSLPSANPPTIPMPSPSSVSLQNSGQFPLKKGARGSMVVRLQKALLAMGGRAAALIRATSMRGSTPDGIFGAGTLKALLAAGYPSSISQTTFLRLVGSPKNVTGAHAFSSSNQHLATTISEAAQQRNLFAVLAGLQKIANIKQYSAVSGYFRNTRILGTRVTSLVNALLSVAFKTNTIAKVKIRAEFRRMGLTQNSSGVWTIQPSNLQKGNFNGINAVPNSPFEGSGAYLQQKQRYDLAVTARPTLLKTADGSYVTPPLNPNTVIGYVLSSHNGITQIIVPSGEKVYAPSSNLRLV